MCFMLAIGHLSLLQSPVNGWPPVNFYCYKLQKVPQAQRIVQSNCHRLDIYICSSQTTSLNRWRQTVYSAVNMPIVNSYLVCHLFTVSIFTEPEGAGYLNQTMKCILTCHPLPVVSCITEEWEPNHEGRNRCSRENRPGFRCPYCPKVYFWKSQMEQHARSHTDERPFRCEQCPKTFKHRFNLNFHSKIHKSGSRRRCDYCTWDFRGENELAVHILIHHRDRNPSVHSTST